MARSRSPSSSKPPVRSDAYVGLLFIALLGQITAAVFFFLDWKQYPEAKPPALPDISISKAAPAPAPAPVGGQAGAQAGGQAGAQAGGMGGGQAGAQAGGMGGAQAGGMQGKN